MSEDDRYRRVDIAGAEVLRSLDRESDRAVALIGAAFVEEALAAVLERVFVDGSAERLLEQSGLRDFAARTNVAYALGLLDQDAYDDLNLVRRIRNAFAHTFDPMSFDDLDAKLSPFKLKCGSFIPSMAPTSRLLARASFIVTVSIRAMQLLRLAELRNRLEVDPFWGSKADEIRDNLRVYLEQSVPAQ